MLPSADCIWMLTTRNCRGVENCGNHLRRHLSAAITNSTTIMLTQADRGADLDFLVGKSGVEVTRESH